MDMISSFAYINRSPWLIRFYNVTITYAEIKLS